MDIKVLEKQTINPYSEVKMTTMGNIIEILYQDKKNSKISIKKISNDQYIYLPTGEVKEFKKIENRLQAINEVRQSMRRLREYINTNAVDPSHCKWVTLTYADNMMDTKKLYKDFKNFVERLRRKIGHFEYIVCMEPQGRGAWHAHMLMIFDDVAPFIDNNSVMQAVWGHGYTKTQKLDDIDNIGLYLTAYLTDMPLNEVQDIVDKNPDLFVGMSNVKAEVKEVDFQGNTKKFVKGARLLFYPPKFNLYRCSKGIKKPLVENKKYKLAKEKIGYTHPTYSRSIELSDSETNFNKIITYEEYNLSR